MENGEIVKTKKIGITILQEIEEAEYWKINTLHLGRAGR